MANNLVKLAEVAQQSGGPIVPNRFPTEAFELYSIPAYDSGKPETALGSSIGSNKTLLRAPCVLFSKLNPRIPRVWNVSPSDSLRQVCSTEFIPFQLDPARVDAEYLAFMMASPQFLEPIQSQVNSSTKSHQRVKPDVIAAQYLPVPTVAEQKQIVVRIKECMDRIDEIEQLRLAAISESRALPTSVFGDFLQELASEGVATVPIGSVLTDVRYGTSQKAASDPIGVPVLRMGNIQAGRIKTDDLKYMSLPPADLAKYKLLEGDILINRTNSLELVGKAGLFTGLQGDWVYASYLVRLRVNPSLVLPEYVNAVINSRVGRDYVLRTARRAIGMVNINAQEIRRLPMPLPSLEVQGSVVERIRQSEVLIDQISEEIRPAIGSPMRAAVLRKAFAGEL